jgi:hypothetical protein
MRVCKYIMIRQADLVRFIGYGDGVTGDLGMGDMLVIGEVEPGGVMYGYLAFWGRIYDRTRHLVWPEEVAFVSAVPIPLKRLPPPFGDGDNEEEHPGYIWTGCRIGNA